MAAIAEVIVTGVNTPVTATRTVLGASDTLTYSSGANQKLVLFNTTASPITLNIDGSGGTTISPPGMGQAISIAAGIDIVVGASATVVVSLDKISVYCQGVVTLTNGTGLIGHLYR